MKWLNFIFLTPDWWWKTEMVTPQLGRLGGISLGSPPPLCVCYLALVPAARAHQPCVLWGEGAWEAEAAKGLFCSKKEDKPR